mmetsp:Transcript_38718/g.124477  ORF Transcript_38718/g.124477 Transcript_38718/m.124477 type:complete len:300 (-) Transcript_38718:303-1202(-)
MRAWQGLRTRDAAADALGARGEAESGERLVLAAFGRSNVGDDGALGRAAKGVAQQERQLAVPEAHVLPPPAKAVRQRHHDVGQGAEALVDGPRLFDTQGLRRCPPGSGPHGGGGCGGGGQLPLRARQVHEAEARCRHGTIGLPANGHGEDRVRARGALVHACGGDLPLLQAPPEHLHRVVEAADVLLREALDVDAEVAVLTELQVRGAGLQKIGDLLPINLQEGALQRVLLLAWAHLLSQRLLREKELQASLDEAPAVSGSGQQSVFGRAEHREGLACAGLPIHADAAVVALHATFHQA